MRVERLRERLQGYVRAQAWDAAELTLTRWAADHPEDLEPALHACRIRLDRAQYRAAYGAIAAGLAASKCPPELLLDTLLCLQELAAAALMPVALRRCVNPEAVGADDLARCASVLMRFGLASEAGTLLNLAAQQAPDVPVVLLNRAFLAFYGGDAQAAEVHLERIIIGPQDVAIAHWLLARQRRQTRSANHVARLRQRLSHTELHPEDRAYLGFALFKELDDLGDYSSAWPVLAEANATLAALRPYDGAAVERRFARIRAQCSDFTAPSPRTVAGAEAHPVPVFIVGMHRCGSSLLEQLLSAIPGVLACGETQRLRAAVAYASDRSADIESESFWSALPRDLDAAAGAAHFFELTPGLTAATQYVTEKWPLNFQCIGLIRRIFPNARIIHMRRAPLDLCFANYRERLGDHAAHLYSLTALAHFHRAYLDLLDDFERRYPGWILDVHYEQLVQDPQAQLQRVLAYLGLDPALALGPTDRRQRTVATPSAAQVRERVYTDSVGRWMHYRQPLEPLRQFLTGSG